MGRADRRTPAPGPCAGADGRGAQRARRRGRSRHQCRDAGPPRHRPTGQRGPPRRAHRAHPRRAARRGGAAAGRGAFAQRLPRPCRAGARAPGRPGRTHVGLDGPGPPLPAPARPAACLAGAVAGRIAGTRRRHRHRRAADRAGRRRPPLSRGSPSRQRRPDAGRRPAGHRRHPGDARPGHGRRALRRRLEPAASAPVIGPGVGRFPGRRPCRQHAAALGQGGLGR